MVNKSPHSLSTTMNFSLLKTNKFIAHRIRLTDRHARRWHVECDESFSLIVRPETVMFVWLLHCCIVFVRDESTKNHNIILGQLPKRNKHSTSPLSTGVNNCISTLTLLTIRIRSYCCLRHCCNTLIYSAKIFVTNLFL